jgi:hypothetical protein
MSTNWVNDIAEMHLKYGVRDWVKNANDHQLRKFIEFRMGFIKEEFEETLNAMLEKNPEEMVDGLIDLCVVAIGTLDAFDVNAQEAWDRVHTANMAKEVGVKPERPNPLGLPDLVKPEGWQAPNHIDNHGILLDALKG